MLSRGCARSQFVRCFGLHASSGPGKPPKPVVLPTFPSDADYLFGVSPVQSALEAKKRLLCGSILVQAGIEIKEALFDRCREVDLAIVRAPKFQLDILVGNRPHQGYVLPCSPMHAPLVRNVHDLHELSSQARSTAAASPLMLCLDEVMDPMNLGALLRSAFLLSVAGVLVSARNSAPLTPTVSKASAGALELMTDSIFAVDRMDVMLEEMKRAGYWVIAAAGMEDTVSAKRMTPGVKKLEYSQLSRLPPLQKRVLVLGNEGAGLRTNVLRSCSHVTSIPMRSHSTVDSFNVSVAGALLMDRLRTTER
ncbi:mitochondrial tRNA/rRNA methyltransferase (SpoU) family protein [Andalucia godoyi]|uniref:rRNA methyltransferase 1, mitochondrial n=1 Tax=Andalucia godoyi TaxID=505711 RepID=A0A8K0AJM6_ANDGO|nr:mitochondrial tRNA/rRNA methyltransferase (SpoU) family protein [Andalucia godoyi]|eukprot:ANDGO_05221.mRNA.1 mitochondrial tRNA/rRNA methyltransferase (SpoU) family protein